LDEVGKIAVVFILINDTLRCDEYNVDNGPVIVAGVAEAVEALFFLVLIDSYCVIATSVEQLDHGVLDCILYGHCLAPIRPS
jgi:hypothetical protein